VTSCRPFSPGCCRTCAGALTARPAPTVATSTAIIVSLLRLRLVPQKNFSCQSLQFCNDWPVRLTAAIGFQRLLKWIGRSSCGAGCGCPAHDLSEAFPSQTEHADFARNARHTLRKLIKICLVNNYKSVIIGPKCNP